MSDDFRKVLASLTTQGWRLDAGAHLFHRDDPVMRLFVVMQGRVGLLRHAEDGTRLILQRAGPGDVVAEASLFSKRYHCDAVAETDCELRSIPKRHFRERIRNDPDFAEAWVRHVSGQVQELRLRSEILSLNTVAARLDAWLAWHEEAPPKGEWKRLAEQIGVSPEALYRELARRRA